jgi:hypothetical protein
VKLFEIDEMLREAVQIAEQSVDTETGEIPEDWAAFLDELELARDKKCLAIAGLIKEYKAEADAVKAEAAKLAARAKTAGNKAERLKAWLSGFVTEGEKMSNSWAAISWRRSSSVVIDDEKTLPENYWKIVREPMKTEIKKALAAGIELPAHIEEKQNLQIK